MMNQINAEDFMKGLQNGQIQLMPQPQVPQKVIDKQKQHIEDGKELIENLTIAIENCENEENKLVMQCMKYLIDERIPVEVGGIVR